MLEARCDMACSLLLLECRRRDAADTQRFAQKRFAKVAIVSGAVFRSHPRYHFRFLKLVGASEWGQSLPTAVLIGAIDIKAQLRVPQDFQRAACKLRACYMLR